MVKKKRKAPKKVCKRVSGRKVCLSPSAWNRMRRAALAGAGGLGETDCGCGG